MRIIESTIVYPIPSKKDIKELADYFRVTFPHSYVRFIEKYNGAVVEGAEFLLDGREYMIERFLNILDDVDRHPDGIYTIDVVFAQIDERLVADDDMMGSDLVPIATVFAGDMVCLDYRQSFDEPTVCVWSHEESYDSNPVTYHVADTFGSFLEML